MKRRDLIALSALAAAGMATSAFAETGMQHSKRMDEVPEDAPLVQFLIYPRMVAIDLIGPMSVFKIMRWRMELVWKDTLPVSSDLMPFTPTHSFTTASARPDVLLVVGGIMGTIACMNDPDVMAFVARQGATSTWVTSVCTGGLVLGAAGLLRGYDATAHWGVADLLPLLGARHVDRRVVIDRNRMTGGGATAGIDFGLTLAATIGGEEAARKVQLILEYAPAPPFANGTPAEAGPERMAAARAGRVWMDEQARLAAEAASRRLGL